MTFQVDEKFPAGPNEASGMENFLTRPALGDPPRIPPAPPARVES